ncbi:hypothetical protein Hanom_Chr02g00120981 [Helianthus anomalus]
MQYIYKLINQISYLPNKQNPKYTCFVKLARITGVTITFSPFFFPLLVTIPISFFLSDFPAISSKSTISVSTSSSSSSS